MDTPSPALYRLSPQTVLRLQGPDRLRYLNGQVTQDLHGATSSTAVFACILNAKGQLQAVCHVREHDDSYLIDAPIDLREELFARLDRYIIADDVELSDESDQWEVFHAIGGPVPETLSQWETTRLGRPGIDIFSRNDLSLEGFAPRDSNEFRVAGILDGIPAWGSELTRGLLPPEAGLEHSAISYDKGCYIGQEVISRIKHAGKTNKHLVQMTVPASVAAPALLTHEGQEAGRITSVAPSSSSEDTAPALGYRKRKFAEVREFEIQNDSGRQLEGIARVQIPAGT